jgi:hypothetical protein
MAKEKSAPGESSLFHSNGNIPINENTGETLGRGG